MLKLHFQTLCAKLILLSMSTLACYYSYQAAKLVHLPIFISQCIIQYHHHHWFLSMLMCSPTLLDAADRLVVLSCVWSFFLVIRHISSANSRSFSFQKISQIVPVLLSTVFLIIHSVRNNIGNRTYPCLTLLCIFIAWDIIHPSVLLRCNFHTTF